MDEEDELSLQDQEWLDEHLESLEFFEGSDEEDDYEIEVKEKTVEKETLLTSVLLESKAAKKGN